MRPPAALTDRRKFGERYVGARIRLRVDHRRDDAFGAEIECTACGGEFADGDPHDRGRAALAHLRNRCQHRGRVPQSVLAVERDRGKALAADQFGDDRRRQAAPAAVDGLAGAQPAGEREGGLRGHEIIVLCSSSAKRLPRRQEADDPVIPRGRSLARKWRCWMVSSLPTRLEPAMTLARGVAICLLGFPGLPLPSVHPSCGESADRIP